MTPRVIALIGLVLSLGTGYVGYVEGRAEAWEITQVAVEYKYVADRLSAALTECRGRHFQKLLPLVLRHEGVSKKNPTGLANIPNDPGGVTNWGISQRAWTQIQADGVLTKFPSDVRDLTKAQAERIYKIVYYLPVFDSLPRDVALVAFDAEVNQNKARRFLAQAKDSITADEVLWARLEHYVSISQRSRANQEFLARFWLPRLIKLRKEAKSACSNG